MTAPQDLQHVHLPESDPNVLDLYFADLSQFSLLTHDEERELARRVRAGDAWAREQFTLANLRLVAHLARRYTGNGLPLEDLIGEGNIGLLRAVDRFDPDRGTHFATHAAWWIKQAILRALDNQARTLRIPSFALARLRRLHACGEAFYDQLGRGPTTAELSHACGLTSAEVERLLTIGQSMLSLDLLRGEEEDCDLYRLFSSRDEEGLPLSDLCAEETRAGCSPHIESMLSCLTLREREAILLHFGLSGAEEQNLREIGQTMGVCKERVRQLLHTALDKLHQSQEAQTIQTLLFEQQAS